MLSVCLSVWIIILAWITYRECCRSNQLADTWKRGAKSLGSRQAEELHQMFLDLAEMAPAGGRRHGAAPAVVWWQAFESDKFVTQTWKSGYGKQLWTYILFHSMHGYHVFNSSYMGFIEVMNKSWIFKVFIDRRYVHDKSPLSSHRFSCSHYELHILCNQHVSFPSLLVS